MRYFLTIVLLCTSSVIAGRQNLAAKHHKNTETGRGVLSTILGTANKLCFCQCGIANIERYERALTDSSTVGVNESESKSKVKVRQSINTPKDQIIDEKHEEKTEDDKVALDLSKDVKASTEENKSHLEEKQTKVVEKKQAEKNNDKPKDEKEAIFINIALATNDKKDVKETTTEKSDKIVTDKKDIPKVENADTEEVKDKTETAQAVNDKKYIKETTTEKSEKIDTTKKEDAPKVVKADTDNVKEKTEKVVAIKDGDKIKTNKDTDLKLSNAENKEAPEGRLIGGDVPPPHEFPWLVLVLVKSELAAGGALITDRHILTAASPLILAVPVDVKVTLGVHDRCGNDATSVNISVEAITRHPGFSAVERAHDLALLTLATSPRFDKRINPICLPASHTSYKNQVTTVVSFLSPTVARVDPPSCLPRRVRQPVLSRAECAQSVSSQSLLTPDKSCIGVFGSTNIFCGGDVGSPVQYPIGGDRYELLGILTDVNTCNTNNSTLFVRVADHLNWIAQSTSQDCYCTRF